MDTLRANIKLEKDAVKAKIKETRVAVRENALKRFDEAVVRINNLKDRVNTQITKLLAKGVDTTNAENLVATAETKLSDIKTKIAEANALLAVSVDELTAENKTALKTMVKEIETMLRDAHKALNDAVKALKDAAKIRIEAEINATASGATE